MASARWRKFGLLLGVLLAPAPVRAQTLEQPKAGTNSSSAPLWGTTVTGSVPSGKPAPKAVEKRRAPVAVGRIASGVTLAGDAARTQISFDLTGTTRYAVFRMTNPFRVVVDLEDVTFRFSPGSGQQGLGLITAFRYGQFAPGKARIVIDTTGAARIEAAQMTAGSGPVRLDLTLVPTTASELAAAELAAAAQSIDLRQPDAPAAPTLMPQTPKPRDKPVIVIDPGHGGIDPGAQGAHGYEKDVVLAVALEIRRSLLAGRRYEVVLTRSSDVFLSLDQRVKLSRKHQADLFLSVHADSLAQKELAQNIRGATVYTLAEKATDDRARALAEKENASDLLAGLQGSGDVGDGQVRSILVDLMRRETSNLATDFRGALVSQLRSKVRLAKEPLRSAPFKVLRQPGSPAVLIELGYMSNAEDEKQMGTQAWQRGVGEAVAKAVEGYFRRRTADVEP